jgi:hypothetical protein
MVLSARGSNRSQIAAIAGVFEDFGDLRVCQNGSWVNRLLLARERKENRQMG